MLQQTIALLIILFFMARVISRRKKDGIRGTEFVLWLVFWIFAALVIIFLKYIDSFVASIGFSGRGIDILLYLAVVLLFYFVFKLGLKIEKIERDITIIVRQLSIKHKTEKE